MKHTRKTRTLLAMGMGMILLFIPPISATAATLDSVRAEVISNDLRKAMAENSSSEYSVMVSLKGDAYDAYEKELLNISETRSSLSSLDTLDETQAQISAQRAQSSAFYQAQNQAAIKGKVDSEDIEYISRYSPVVMLTVEAGDINQLALNRQVQSITYVNDNVSEATIDLEEPISSTFTAPYAMDTEASRAIDVQPYLKLLKISSLQQYATGSGIKVGMVEAYIPNTTYLNSLNMTVAGTYPANPKIDNIMRHADLVASIMKDLAPNITLYCAGMVSTGDSQANFTTMQWQVRAMQAIEWLLDQDVNVINMSAVIDLYVNPETPNPPYTNTYNSLSAWYDHITCYHAVTLVCGVGNDGSNGVGSSSLAYNSIAVGGVDRTGSIHRELIDDELIIVPSYNPIYSIYAPKKPDISAPSEDIIVGEVCDDGTSFAAPHITAIVAMMMQLEPDLLWQPEAIKAMLSANVNTAYTVCTTERVYGNPYEQYGAGIPSAAALYASMRLDRYHFEYFNPQQAGNSFEYPITLLKQTNNRISLAFSNKVVLSCDSDNLNDLYCYNIPVIEIEIWHEGVCLASTDNAYNSVKILSYYSEEQLNCTLKIKFKESTSHATYLAYAWYYHS